MGEMEISCEQKEFMVRLYFPRKAPIQGMKTVKGEYVKNLILVRLLLCRRKYKGKRRCLGWRHMVLNG